MQRPRWFRIRSGGPASGPFASVAARRVIIVGWIVVTILCAGIGVLGFRIDNSVGVWFDKDDPALVDYRRFLDDFGGREWMLVVLRMSPADRNAQAADRDRLVARLERVANVHWVLSMASFPQESELVREFMKPHPHSPYEALLLQVTNDIDRQDGYREALLDDIRVAAADLPSVLDLHIAGTAVINGELNQAARRDMFLFFPLVALFVATLGMLVFRNPRDTAVLLSVALGTVIVTQGLLIGAGYPLNMITIMLPTVLIALSVADAVHLIHAYHAARQRSGDDAAAAVRAVTSVAGPCAGTSLTTMAGFLAFAGSSVLPVFQLAIFGAFGIALAWTLTMTVAPVLLVTLWRGRDGPASPAVGLGTRLLERWWRFAAPRPRRIVLAFALGSAALIGLASLRADTDYVKFFRPSTRVPQDYQVFERAGFPQNPLNLVFRVPSGETPMTPRYWTRLDAFARELATLPGVHSVLSPFVMAGSPEAMGDHLETLGGMLSRERDQLQLVVMMDYPSSQELFRLLPRIRALAADRIPANVQMTATGTSLLWARMDDGVIRTQKQSLIVVSVVCFVILTVLFRSLRLAALGLVVSLYPVGMVLGLMGWWNIPVNLATVLIAGIAVGLAVDDTIHYLHAYQRERRRMDRASACEQALHVVGLRVVMTSVILVGGFAIMGLSNFMPTSQFGLLSSLTILLALAADLALLPVVLSWRRGSTRLPPAGSLAPRCAERDPELGRRAAWGRLT